MSVLTELRESAEHSVCFATLVKPGIQQSQSITERNDVFFKKQHNIETMTISLLSSLDQISYAKLYTA